MIRIYIVSILAFAGLCFGCGEDNGVEFRFEGEEILLTAGFESVSRVSASAFDANDRIGVFVTKYNGDEAMALQPTGNYVDNHLFTANGKNISTEEVLYYPASGNVDIFGYHPYSEQVTSTEAYAFPIGVDQSSLDKLKACDFVWAKRTNVAPNNSVINLTFRHLMSKISVSIEAGQEIDDLSGLEVKICGTSVNASVNLADGKVSLTDMKKEEIVPLETSSVSSSPVLKKSYQAIVAPQVLAEGMLLIEATLNGKKYTYWTGAGGQIFGAGKVQNYGLIINAYQREMLLKSTTVTGWTSNGSEVNADVLPDVEGRDVLMAFYNAAGGDQWTNKTNWGSQNIEDWYGVTVEDNEVVAIDLSDNNLKGKIPAELFYLTKLKKLRLERNQLFDTIPSTLGRIATLEELDLSRNQLSGQMPKEIGQLSGLTTLILRDNKLSGNVPKWVSWLNCYHADSVARQYNANGAEIMLEVEGMGQEGEKYIGDVTFTSQAELNTFAAKGYTEILGSLTIERNYYGTNISNIPKFAGLKKVHGSVIVEPDLGDYTVFADLEYVGGDFSFSTTNELLGEGNLEYVGGMLSISSHGCKGFNKLKYAGTIEISGRNEISGFSNLLQVQGTLSFIGRELSKIDGFEKLQRVEEIFIKNGNDPYYTSSDLQKIPEFNSLTQITKFTIERTGVKSLSGFNNVRYCQIDIRLCNNLVEFSVFENLKDGAIQIRECRNLTKIPKFNALDSIEYINIYSCDALTELSGFENLKKIYGYDRSYGRSLGISHCSSLLSISGFNVLQEMKEELEILYCERLSSISEFEKLEFVGNEIKLGDLKALSQQLKFPALIKVDNISIRNVTWQEVTGFNNVREVKQISIESNSELKEISGFNKLQNVDAINLVSSRDYYDPIYNVKLEKVTGFTNLNSLKNLNIVGCYSLQSFEGLSNLNSLGALKLSKCYSLVEFPSLGSNLIIPSVEIDQNTALDDYTNLKPMIDENTTITIINNKYNPTKEDILAGKVKPE